MAKQFGTIHVKVERGKLTLVGTGSTPRGQSYIKGMQTIEAAKIADKSFKQAMKAAVDKLMD